MMPRPATDSLKSLGTVFAPIIVVLLTAAIFTSRGPSDVRGAPQTDEAITARVTTSIPAVTEAAVAAEGRVRALRDHAFGADPLLHDGTRRTTSQPIAEDEESFIPEAPAPLHANLQAIMAGSAGTVAVINGRSYRVGDRLPGERWRIALIDSDRRTVTFVDEATGSAEDRVLTR